MIWIVPSNSATASFLYEVSIAVIELVKNRIETFEVEINEGTEDPKKLGKAPY